MSKTSLIPGASWVRTMLRHTVSVVALGLACQFRALSAEEAVYPDLRDSQDLQLQALFDEAFGKRVPNFWRGVRRKELSVVIADVTDLERPRVAWYNPEHMVYVVSLPSSTNSSRG